MQGISFADDCALLDEEQDSADTLHGVQTHKPLPAGEEMNTKICSTPWSRARGLMFSRKRKCILGFDKELIIPLHTWFVFFPIKVEFLDGRKRLVERAVMQPFSRYTPKNRAKYVIETPV